MTFLTHGPKKTNIAVRRKSWLSFLTEPLRFSIQNFDKCQCSKVTSRALRLFSFSHPNYFPFSSSKKFSSLIFMCYLLTKHANMHRECRLLIFQTFPAFKDGGRIKQGRRLASSNNKALINTWNIYRTHKEQRKLNTSSVYDFSQCFSQQVSWHYFFSWDVWATTSEMYLVHVLSTYCLS